MPHESSVDEEELMGAFFPCRLRFPHKSGYLTHRGIGLDGQKVLTDLLAIHIDDTLPETAFPQVVHLYPIAMERESNLRIDQHNALKCRHDIIQFGSIRF